MSDDVNLNAYFERIGFSGSIAPTLQTLETLHVLQPAAIPFENVNSLLGLPVPLDQPSLERKLLAERRGGYCFELNLMFLRVLLDLGYEARGHVASVLWGGRPVDDVAPDHMAITVDISGSTYLADVGFGGLLQTAPLRLRAGIEQETPLGKYRIIGENPAFQLELQREAEEWRPVYRFSIDPVADPAYAEINQRLNADPEWFFHHHLLVERAPPSGRRMLFDTRLTTFAEGAREVRTLASGAEIRDTLAAHFGLILPQAEGLDAALARLVTRNVMAG